MVLHRGAMLKRIYDWCIDAAHKPYALWIMGAVAFAESSFFPVPPDVMLIPMSLARPQRAWVYAAICTATSVLGGLLGYAIGALLFDSVGHWLIEVYGLGGKVDAFRASYAEWGAVIILLKGLTPIPYKLVTITSGFAGYNLGLFILCSIVARGGRARLCRVQSRALHAVLDRGALRALLYRGDPAKPLRRLDPDQDREAS